MQVFLLGGAAGPGALGKPGAGALGCVSGFGAGVEREGAGALAFGTTCSVGGSSRTLLRMKFVGSLAGWRSAPQLRQSCLRGLWCGKWQSAQSQAIGTSLPLMDMTAGFPPSLIVGCPPAGPDENTLMAADFGLRLLVLLLPLFAPLPDPLGVKERVQPKAAAAAAED